MKDNKIQIYFPIGAYYPSQIGGPCNTIYSHITELRKYAYDITVITTMRGIEMGRVSKVNKMFVESDVNIYYGTGNSYSFKTVLKAIREIKGKDIIHLNSLFDFLSIATFFSVILFGSSKKIVWSTRGELSVNALSYGSKFKGALLKVYKHFQRKIIFHSTSAKETDDIKRVFNESRVIYEPNYLQMPTRLRNVEVDKTLLFLGRIHPIKGLVNLIEALNISQNFKTSDYILRFVGTYETRHIEFYNSLLQLIQKYNLEDKILFSGHLEGLEKEMAYASASLLILPSFSENFGNVVVEALNQGTPVLASTGTPWEILVEGNCGYHVSNEPLTLALTIDNYLSLGDGEKEKMRLNAMNLVDEKFNIVEGMKNWNSIYRKMLLDK